MIDNKTYGPQTYAKVRVSKGVTRLIEVSRETDYLISGMRVFPSGERWFRETTDEEGREVEQEELVVAKQTDVIKRYKMNLFYGELEEV